MPGQALFFILTNILGKKKFLVENFLSRSLHREEKQINVSTERLTKSYMYVYPHNSECHQVRGLWDRCVLSTAPAQAGLIPTGTGSVAASASFRLCSKPSTSMVCCFPTAAVFQLPAHSESCNQDSCEPPLLLAPAVPKPVGVPAAQMFISMQSSPLSLFCLVYKDLTLKQMTRNQ